MAELEVRTHLHDAEEFILHLDIDEIDVVYRVLKLCKQNETSTRLSVVQDILQVIQTEYANDLRFLNYEDDQELSADHFGSVIFK